MISSKKTNSGKETTGCLLIHGFTGSPNELEPLRDFLANHQIEISVPTLPGHGTYSGDLLNYSWYDWYSTVKTAYRELLSSCDKVFACGLSMGGTLVLHLAAHEPVEAVITLAAPISFPTWKKQAVRLLKNLIKYRYKKNGEDIRDISQKSQLGSYGRFPLRAAEQFFRLLDHVHNDLPEVEQPILIMHSKMDHTVPFYNSDIIFDKISSTDKTKIPLEKSYHVITADVEKVIVQKHVLEFIRNHSG